MINLHEDFLIKTPLIFSENLSNQFNNNIFLKLESMQISNSFKIRGAAFFFKYLIENNILEKNNLNHISTYTTGNHGIAVCYLSNLYNIPVKVYAPSNISLKKIKIMQDYCNKNPLASLILVASRLEAEYFAKNSKDSFFLHPSGNEIVLNGISKIIDEIYIDFQNQLPYAILAPCGGGGLVSGLFKGCLSILQKNKLSQFIGNKYYDFIFKYINKNQHSAYKNFHLSVNLIIKVKMMQKISSAKIFYIDSTFKSIKLLSKNFLRKNYIPRVKTYIYACEPENANDAYISKKNNQIFRFQDSPKTIADSLCALSLSDLSFKYIKQIEKVFLVSEQNLKIAHKEMIEICNLEISSSIVLSALKQWHLENSSIKKQDIVLIISGNN